MKELKIWAVVVGVVAIAGGFALCNGLAVTMDGGQVSPDKRRYASIVDGSKLEVGPYPPGMFRTEPCVEVKGKILAVHWKSNVEIEVALSKDSEISRNDAQLNQVVLDIVRRETH